MSLDNNKYKKYKAEFDKIVTTHSSRIVVTSHRNSDGDSISSTLALYYYLTEILKIKNVVIYITGAASPKFSSLFLYEKVNYVEDIANEISEDDLVIFLDSNNYSQFTNNPSEIKSSKFILIDHHTNVPDMTFEFKINPEVTKENYSSVAEMLYLFFLFDQECPQELCKTLYLGLYTDSGGFMYTDKYRSRCYLIAYELVTKGNIFVEEFLSPIFSKSFGSIKIMSILISNLKKDKVEEWPDFVYSYLPSDVFSVYSAEDITNGIGMFKPYLNSISGATWGFLVRCTESDDLSISFRSIFKPGASVNVRNIAEKFGGGGHVMAAACKVKDLKDVNAGINMILDYLKEHKPIYINN